MNRSTLAGAAFVVLVVVVFYIRMLPQGAGRGTVQSEPTVREPRTEATRSGPDIYPLTLQAGDSSITLETLPRRIVSLAPSDTEILFDVGAGDRIVGDTTACDYPPAAALKPHIGGFSDMSVEKIMARNPDLVVADTSIDRSIVQALRAAHVPVLALEAHTLEDVYNSVITIGRAVGQKTEAEKVVSDMKARFEALRAVAGSALSRPAVLTMYGVDPIYTTGPGSYIDDVIRIAGGHNIATGNQISSEAVLSAAPDVIICDPSLVEKVSGLPGWSESVPAVRNHAFFNVTGDAVLVRPVPRLADAAEQLVRYLHPELFTSSGHPADLTTGVRKP